MGKLGKKLLASSENSQSWFFKLVSNLVQKEQCRFERYSPFHRLAGLLKGAHTGRRTWCLFQQVTHCDRNMDRDTGSCSWSPCSQTSCLDQSIHSTSSGFMKERDDVSQIKRIREKAACGVWKHAWKKSLTEKRDWEEGWYSEENV